MSGIASLVLLALLIFWGDRFPWVKDNKKTFVSATILCLAVTGFWAWRSEYKKRQAMEQQWRVKEGLGTLLAQGNNLRDRFLSGHQITELDNLFHDWHTATQLFLVTSCGEADLALWRSEVGIELPVANLLVPSDSVEANKRRDFVYRILYYRLVRLTQIIDKLPLVTRPLP